MALEGRLVDIVHHSRQEASYLQGVDTEVLRDDLSSQLFVWHCIAGRHD